MENRVPKVSVITPLHNSAQLMHKAVESVLCQSYSDFELILVDDLSTDNTLALAKQYQDSDPRVRVMALLGNLGSGKARNAGIEAAEGRFIAFLDSDDSWEPDKLARQLSQMDEKGCALSYTDYMVHSTDGSIYFIFVAPDATTYRSMLKRPSIGCSTAVYDTQMLGKRYFPNIQKSEDFALWLSILREIGSAHKCGAVLTHYTARPDSISANKLASAKYTWIVLTELENLAIPKAAYYFAHYVGSNLCKRARASIARARRWRLPKSRVRS
jgi:teichuronic acid biosynthesis glycosyltransferase TuaG